MGYFDKTRLESALAELRHWTSRRRSEPSHYYAGIGLIVLAALAGFVLWSAALFGKAIVVIGAAVLGFALGAYYGQRLEG